MFVPFVKFFLNKKVAFNSVPPQEQPLGTPSTAATEPMSGAARQAARC